MQSISLFVCLLGALPSVLCTGSCADSPDCIRIASWNVYYKALDDAQGAAALTQAIDNSGPYDFFGVVEAAGNTPAGAFPAWTKQSKSLDGMQSLSGKSGFETIALFYNASKWTGKLIQVGEFESGRPFLLAQFSSDRCDALYIMVVHLNHFFLHYPDKLDPVVPGSVMASAFANASQGKEKPISKSPVVIMGDFNEYMWPAFPEPYKTGAVKNMKPLWTDYFDGTMQDAVPFNTTSCCTKWAAADRFSTNYDEWRFVYDHIFYSHGNGTLSMRTKLPAFLPYQYPGVSGKCSDSACTGEDPPGNVTATHQGSWHRGVQAELQLQS